MGSGILHEWEEGHYIDLAYSGFLMVAKGQWVENDLI
jgi:hypothetical protein